MTRRAPVLLSSVFVLWLWLIGMHSFLPALQIGSSLRGVAEKPAPPAWTLTGLLDGSVFRAMEEWFSGHVGLHNLWVRLDNQVSYTLFRESPVRESGTRVVVGPDDWLFEHAYITAAITPSPHSTAQLAEMAALIRRVQEKLTRRGPRLLLVVAPSKVELYPEHVPAMHFTGRDPAKIKTTYELLRPHLLAAGVEFFDGPARFAAWKAEGQEHLFARTGTHWSYFAIYHTALELRTLLNPRLHRQIPELDLVSLDYRAPQRTDTDLHRLLNLLLPPFHETDQPFPKLAAQSTTPAENLPRFLWVNDSFGLGLIDTLYHANAMQPTDCLYYFQNIYELPGFDKSDREIAALDWKTYIHEFDAIIVVLTEVAFDAGGWGFFDTLDAALD